MSCEIKVGNYPPYQGTAEDAPKMLICRVYAVSMKTLCVTLKGSTEPLKLAAVKVVDDDNALTLTAFDAKGEKVGMFNMSEVAGWWVE